MQEIFKTPAIIAAIITSAIMAFGTIIQWLIAFTKSNIDTKVNFENSLKEKLEKVYSPLVMLINKRDIMTHLIEDEVKAILNKYGFLLSRELFSDIQELNKLESNRPTGDEHEYLIEYQNLRTKIANQLNKEFSELQSLYNNGFKIYKVNLLKPWYIKGILFVKKSILFITSVFWLVFISLYLLSKIKPIEVFVNKPIVSFIATVLMILIILTTLFTIVVAMIKISIQIEKSINRKRKIFRPYDYVPETGMYKCRCCNEEKKFYKNGEFTNCSSTKLNKKFLAIFYDYVWALNNEHNGTHESVENGLNVSG